MIQQAIQILSLPLQAVLDFVVSNGAFALCFFVALTAVVFAKFIRKGV